MLAASFSMNSPKTSSADTRCCNAGNTKNGERKAFGTMARSSNSAQAAINFESISFGRNNFRVNLSFLPIIFLGKYE